MSYHGTPVVVIEIPEGSWGAEGQTIDTGKISKLIGATQGIKRLAEAREKRGVCLRQQSSAQDRTDSQPQLSLQHRA
jgi:hypothetical protein